MSIRERVLKAVLKTVLYAVGIVLIVLTVHELFGSVASDLCLLGIVGYLIFWRLLGRFFFPKPLDEEETHLR